MTNPISLKEIERKTFSTVFDDGLWDVLLGSLVLMFALAPLLSQSLGDFWSSAIFLPFWLLVYLGVRLLRQRLVLPRVGQVQFGRYRRLRLTRLLILMALVNTLLLAAGIWVASQGSALQWTPSLFLGILALFAFSLAAYLLDMPRLYLYAILLALSPWIGEYLYVNHGVAHHGFHITFGFSAGFIMLAGLVHFLRFLRANPRPEIG